MKIERTKTWYMALMAAMTVMAACSGNEVGEPGEPPLMPDPEPEPTLQIVAALGKGDNRSRTAIDITDPYSTHPDFSKGEKFRWVAGDQICALFNPTDATTYQSVLGVKAADIDGNKASFNISAGKLPSKGTCRMFYPSRGINMQNTEGPSIENIEIPSASSKSKFVTYVCMYSDPFDYDLTQSGTNIVVNNVSFHHLCTLLRFNFWNQTGVPYTIKNITIRYSYFSAFRRRLTFSLTNPANPLYYDDYNYNQYMMWTNDTYQTDPGIVDDIRTPDKNESVYDALMVIYPTTPQSTGTFKISVNLYDTEAKSDYPLQDIVLNCADYAFLRDTGFQKGMRTYFCIDILKDGRTKLRDVQVTPWGEDIDWGNGDVELPD